MFWTKVQMAAAVVAATIAVGAGVPASMKLMAADSAAPETATAAVPAGSLVTAPTAELICNPNTGDKEMPKSFRIGSGLQMIGDYLYISSGGERRGGGIVQCFKWDPQATGNKIVYVDSVTNSVLRGGLVLSAAGGRLYGLGHFVWGAAGNEDPKTYNGLTWYDIEKETGKPVEKGLLTTVATAGGAMLAGPEGKDLYALTPKPPGVQLTWLKIAEDGTPSVAGVAYGPGVGPNPRMSPDGKNIYSIRDHKIGICERKATGEITYKKALSLDCLTRTNVPKVGGVAGISPDGKWVYVQLYNRDEPWDWARQTDCFGVFKRDPDTGDLTFERGGNDNDKEYELMTCLQGMNLLFNPDGTGGFISSLMGIVQSFRYDPATGALLDITEVVTPAMKGRPGAMLALDSKRGLLFGTSSWVHEPYGSTWLGLWAAKTGQTQVRAGVRADIKATRAAADAKAANTNDWPGVRGPNGDGKSPLKGIRKDWTGGLKKVWEVTGLSPFDCTWSPPVVQGDKLIVMGKHGYLEEVLCFDADKGGPPIWIAELPAGEGDGWASGPNVSPFISGDKVYVCYANSRYGCLSMKDGRLLWKKALSAGGHAGARPPIVWEDLVILTGVVRPETGKRGTISAFNKDTGEWVWTYGEDNKRQDLTWTAALKLTINGKDQIVFNTAGFACGLDPRTGKLLWEKIPSPDIKEPLGIYTSPLTDGKTVVVEMTCLGAKNSGLQMERSAFQVDGGVVKELWSATGFTGWTDPILKDGYLYLFLSDGLYSTGNSGFGCFDMKTGKEKWSEKKTGCGSVVEVDGCLLCLTYGGDLWLLDPSPDAFKKITEWKGAVRIQPWWRHTGSPAGVGMVPEVPVPPKTPGAPCWTVPVIARGKLYLRYNDTLTCYDLMPGP